MKPYKFRNSDSKWRKHERRALRGSVKRYRKNFLYHFRHLLIFLFLILVPYFSLRTESKSITEIDSEFNFTNIISALSRLINETSNLKSAYTLIPVETNNTASRIIEYDNKLERIIFFHNNANVTVDNPMMQSILGDLELFPSCRNETFATDNWTNCNKFAKSDLEYKLLSTSAIQYPKRHRKKNRFIF